MTIPYSALLILGALCVLVFVIHKIRRSEVKIAESLSWFLFAASLVLFAVLPQIAFFFSALFGIESPANFVFLYVIAVLFIHAFRTSMELSRLRSKMTLLVQTSALEDLALREKQRGKDSAHSSSV